MNFLSSIQNLRPFLNISDWYSSQPMLFWLIIAVAALFIIHIIVVLCVFARAKKNKGIITLKPNQTLSVKDKSEFNETEIEEEEEEPVPVMEEANAESAATVPNEEVPPEQQKPKRKKPVPVKSENDKSMSEHIEESSVVVSDRNDEAVHINSGLDKYQYTFVGKK